MVRLSGTLSQWISRNINRMPALNSKLPVRDNLNKDRSSSLTSSS